jgi:CBS domain-containing protein
LYSVQQEIAMKAHDVMTEPVISIAPNASILEAVALMLRHKISGLPVLDPTGKLVGIVTEGDFLRRSEIGTQRRRPRWIEFFIPGRLANEYVHASGRRVDEIMSVDVHTVDERAPLEDVVRVLERHRIKRVPVFRGDQLVGIITRANLVRALIGAAKAAPKSSSDDAAIRQAFMAELEKQSWAPVREVNVGVSNGVVTLSGIVTDDHMRQALCVAAENIPGVKRVEDQIAWLIPGTGIVGSPPMIIGPAERDNHSRAMGD